MTNKYLRFTIPLVVYSIITLIFTYPLVNHFSNSIIIDDPVKGDAHQFIWNIYLFKKNLLNFENPFYTDIFFYPTKVNLLMHTYSPVMGIFALPFANNFLALNIFLFLNFVLSAYGTFLLARRYINNDILCFTCGFIFSFSAYKTVHLLGHYHLMLTATLPFFIICFLNGFLFADKKLFPSISDIYYAMASAILFFITGLSDYYSTFFLIYFVILFALYNKYLKTASINWRSYKTWGILILVLTISHLIIRFLRFQGFNDMAAFWWQGDVMALFVPPVNSSLYSEAYSLKLLSLFRISNFGEGILFFGYAFLICSILFFFDLFKGKIKNEIKPIAFISLIFFCIIVPGLKIAGFELLNLPTSILHFVPFINNIRCSPRIFVIFSLVFPIVVLYSLDRRLLSRPIWQSNLIATFIVLVLIIEYKPDSYKLFKEADTPLAFRYLKTIPSEKIVMPIPNGINGGLDAFGNFGAANLFYQTVHDKKLIGGYMSRLDEKTQNLYLSNPVISEIFKPIDKKDSIGKNISEQDISKFFKIFNPGAFVIYPSYRNTSHEKFIYYLIRDKKYTTKEIGKYLIIELI